MWWMHPVLGDPTTLALGNPRSEALIHLWGLWTTTEGLWEHGPYMKVSATGWPHGFREHLMDPLSLLVFAPAAALGGAVLGWNLLHAVALIVGIVGCILLARELDGDPMVLVVGFCASAFMLSVVDHGRTEMLGGLGLPLHLALLHRSLRTRSWRLALLAGVVLGLVANSGPYVAVFSLLLVVPLALIWDRSPLLLVVALPALALALPPIVVLAMNPVEAMAPTLEYGGGVWDFVAQYRVPTEATRSTDLEQCAYIGLVGLGLCLIGGRRTWPWAALAVALTLLSPGPTLDFGPVEFAGPAALLDKTALHGIQHWNRLGVVLALPVAIGASIAARRWRWAPSLAAPLLIADQATWPRLAPSATAWDPSPPSELEWVDERLPPGALVHLPLDLFGGDHVQLRGEYLMWALFHGRPVSARDHAVGDALYDQALLRLAIELQRGLTDRLTEEDVHAARQSAEWMRTQGAAALVFHADRPDARRVRPLLDQAFGPPPRERDPLYAWPLPELGLEPLDPVAP